nr:NACHT domain-containing protein [Candidatus Sigynarchaeota archaeon]
MDDDIYFQDLLKALPQETRDPTAAMNGGKQVLVNRGREQKIGLSTLMEVFKTRHQKIFRISYFIKPFLLKYQPTSDDPFAQKDELRSLSIDEFFETFSHDNRPDSLFFIIGEAGSGKSMALCYIEHTLFNEGYFPLRLELKSMATIQPSVGKFQGEELVNAFIHFCETISGASGVLDKQELIHAIQDRHIILLLDGLDEAVVRSKSLHILDEWLEALVGLSELFSAKILVTCRTTLFEGKRQFSRYQSYELQRWKEVEIIEWIGKNARDINPAVVDSPQNIYNKLSDISPLIELCTNPFLLKCLIEIYSVIGNLKEITIQKELEYHFDDFKRMMRYSPIRAWVYNEMIDKKITDNLRKVAHDTRLDILLMRKLLVQIAIHYLTNRSAGILLEDVDFAATPGLNQMELQTNKYVTSPEYRLKLIQILRNNSLLEVGDSGGCIFAHQTFAEFLAAGVVYQELREHKMEYLQPSNISPEVFWFLIGIYANSTSKYPSIDEVIAFLVKPCPTKISNLLLRWIFERMDVYPVTGIIKLLSEGFSYQEELDLSRIKIWGKKCIDESEIKDITWLDILLLKNKQLKRLNLSQCDLKELPDTIGVLGALEALDLHENSLTTLPDSIIHLGSLRTLDISKNGLTELPNTIGYLICLETLDLENNNLFTIPATIHKLESLQALNLKKNKMTGLPASFILLKKLKRLDLGNNGMTSIPPELFSLIVMQELLLDHNKLVIVPEALFSIKSLRILDLSHNSIRELPKSISARVSLEDLYIGYNNIREIPKWMKSLPLLRTLQIDGLRLNMQAEPAEFKSKLAKHS